MQTIVIESTAEHPKASKQPDLWQTVKDAISGQTLLVPILSRFGFNHIEPKREFICPKCGEKKARISSDIGLGGCNACGVTWPNIVDFIAFAAGSDPNDCCRRIAAEFSISGGSSGSRGGAARPLPPASPRTPKPAPARDPDGYCRRRSVVSEFSTIAPKVLSSFVGVGRGFTAQAIKELECQAVSITARSHPAIPPQSAIAFPVYGRLGLSISNHILRPTREDASIIGCGPDGKVEKRKKTVAYAPAKGAEYDRSGIVCTPAVRDALKRGEPLPGVHVVKLEGELDVASSLSILSPDEYLVFTNAHGARELLPWVIELFSKLNPASWILIGDRDEAGESGAARWANEIMRICPGSIVRVPILPLEFSPTKGADFRDWIRSGATISDFEKLIEKTHSWTEAKEQAEAPKPKTEQQAAPMQSESVNISEHDSQAGQQLQEGSGNGAFSELQRIAEESGIQYGDWEEDAGFEEGQAGGKATPSGPNIVSFGEMVRQFEHLRPVVIDGLLRETEVCNVIAAPKVGKSYLVGSMGLSIASGRPWLGMDVAEGEVLFLDNELHPELTTSRLRAIARGMEIDERTLDDRVQVLSLRGRNVDIHTLGQFFDDITQGRFKLVVIDALYRLLPSGTSENDNAAMTSLYNRFDEFAAKLGSAIVLVHHSSKGDQSTKGITDMGSGAGAISRAADTHVAIRPHEQDGLAVLEAVTRSFRQPSPLSIRWEYPLWQAVTTPPVLRRINAGQDARDREADQAALELFRRDPEAWLSYSQLRNQLGFGKDRAERLLKRLCDHGTVETMEDERKGGSITVYRLKARESQ